MQAESLAGPGNMPSLDLVGRMLGDSWAKARVVNSNQKKLSSRNFFRGLI